MRQSKTTLQFCLSMVKNTVTTTLQKIKHPPILARVEWMPLLYRLEFSSCYGLPSLEVRFMEILGHRISLASKSIQSRANLAFIHSWVTQPVLNSYQVLSNPFTEMPHISPMRCNLFKDRCVPGGLWPRRHCHWQVQIFFGKILQV